MMTSVPPDIQLMLVRDPKETVQAICALENPFQLQDFISSYEKIRKLEKSIHIKNAHTHFYSLRLFGFIEQVEGRPKGVYQKSETAIEICKLLPSNEKKAARKIRNLLLENVEKGPLFQDFEQFAKTKKEFTMDEVKNRYVIWRTIPSLIEWSVFGKIIDIDRNQNKMWYLGNDEGKDIPVKDFSDHFFKVFYMMKSETAFGVEIYYADISKIRTKMCLSLDWSNGKWDKHMTKLLNSPKGKQLRLYGSTPSTFETKQTFSYDGTSYAYIGIND